MPQRVSRAPKSSGFKKLWFHGIGIGKFRMGVGEGYGPWRSAAASQRPAYNEWNSIGFTTTNTEDCQGGRHFSFCASTQIGSWNCHGVTESTEPVEKRAALRYFILTPRATVFQDLLKMSLVICCLCGLGASVANCRF